MPNIREVAVRAGVSPATVSRVLNEYPYIRDEVRDKVLTAIAELGYSPNRVAQRLRATHSRVIGIVVSDITNPFNNAIMSSIEDVFFDLGFSVLMSNTQSNADREIKYLALMKKEGVAGLIIAPTSENVLCIEHLADHGMPIVVIDRRLLHPFVDVVLSDNASGARTAVEHLIRLGHHRIGHIGGPRDLASGRERFQGYRQALEHAGLPIPANWVRFGDHYFEGGYRAALELLQVSPPLTALFVANNMMTLGALTALHERGRRIPEDIAVVGFDDMPWAASLNPPLTTVRQPTEEIGHKAAELLLERIDNPGLFARRLALPTKLIVRASCGSTCQSICRTLHNERKERTLEPRLLDRDVDS